MKGVFTVVKEMTEAQLQRGAARFFDHLNILWCHVGNERKAKVQYYVKLKSMGVKAGVPDVLIFEPRGKYNGLAFELKVGKNMPTKKQAEWILALKERGWKVLVRHHLEDVMKETIDYLSLKQST